MASIAVTPETRACGIPLIDAQTAPLLARPLFERDDPGPIAAALAHVPELMEVALPFFGRVLGPSHLDVRIKEIVILRASAIAHCRYCVDAHTVAALDGGLEHDEVAALRDVEAARSPLSGAEAALVAYVDVVAGDRGTMPARIANELLAWFADYEVVELTLLAATTLLLNRFCTALALPSSPATLARLASEGFA